jgi:hypothetical protein
MADAREIVARSRDLYGTVPNVSEDYVCDLCCGAVTGYSQCFACHTLFHGGGVPRELRGRVVPVSAALSPSLWYTYLQTYKAGHPDRSTQLVALATLFVIDQARRIAEVLDGDPTITTIVPSKRGHTFEDQPLRMALARGEVIRPSLRQLLEFKGTERVGRSQYRPSAFDGVADLVEDQRVLLFEDTWVTGATALSAAGRLLELGAAAVLIAPLARMVDVAYFGVDHPYCVASRRPYDSRAWPR